MAPADVSQVQVAITSLGQQSLPETAAHFTFTAHKRPAEGCIRHLCKQADAYQEYTTAKQFARLHRKLTGYTLTTIIYHSYAGSLGRRRCSSIYYQPTADDIIASWIWAGFQLLRSPTAQVQQARSIRRIYCVQYHSLYVVVVYITVPETPLNTKRSE